MRCLCRFRPALEALEPRTTPSVYVVSPFGSDAADGSADAPWLTLQRAANAVQPGDRVLVEPGEYAGFHLTRDGQPGLPIQFLAQPGVQIVAHNARTPDGINLEGASDIVIDGFTVTGMPRAGIRAVLNSDVTLRNNTCYANGWWGIFTGFSNRVVIESNVTAYSAIEHGIYVSNSCVGPVVRDNVIFGNAKNGIHMNGDVREGGTGLIHGALIDGNTIFDNGRGGGSGINLDGVQDSTIQNNVLYDNHASGISLYCQNAAAGASNNLVVNNTVVMAPDARWALNIQNASTGNVVFNNILFNTHAWHGSVNISADSLPGFVSDYNALTDGFTTDDEATVVSLGQWQATLGLDAHSFSATADSLFAGAARDYRLAAGSQAAGAGVATLAGRVAPSHDRDGNDRTSGLMDLGAYQTAAGTPFVPEWPWTPVWPDDPPTDDSGGTDDDYVVCWAYPDEWSGAPPLGDDNSDGPNVIPGELLFWGTLEDGWMDYGAIA